MSSEIDWTRMFEIVRGGYGGILANGNLVDRREYPQAIPIAESTLLCAPKPKEVDGFARGQINNLPPMSAMVELDSDEYEPEIDYESFNQAAKPPERMSGTITYSEELQEKLDRKRAEAVDLNEMSFDCQIEYHDYCTGARDKFILRHLPCQCPCHRRGEVGEEVVSA